MAVTSVCGIVLYHRCRRFSECDYIRRQKCRLFSFEGGVKLFYISVILTRRIEERWEDYTGEKAEKIA